jgi:hypothetical protein
MFDKICSFLILPLYALWKILLRLGFEKKGIQHFVFKVTIFFSVVAFATYFLDSKHLMLQIIFGFLLLIVLMTSFRMTKNSIEDVLKKNELTFLANKWLKYKRTTLLIFTSSLLSFVFIYPPLLLSTLCQFFSLFIFVGFEFPDEPPKKKESESKNGSWLAKLIPPRPVTSN